jgi:transposase
MEVMHKRVAGLDVHKAAVTACVRVMSRRRVTRECRTFDTTTDGLIALREWLGGCGGTHAAMEATGVSWMPVWKILCEGDFGLTVANAAHLRNVPGRKTDMNDAMRIAGLMACGLMKASFVPAEGFQELRSLMRTRKQLSREQTRHLQRMQKTLEEANIKLDSVLSASMGASARRMIGAMIEGVRDPKKLASLAGKGLKASPKQLYDALHGRLTDHHRFLLKLHLEQWDALDAAILEIERQAARHIARMDEKLKDQEEPFFAVIARLCPIPGVSTLSAATILAEIGRDMSRFPHIRASGGAGWPLPRPERERRQTQALAPAQRGCLVENDARAMRLGGQAQKGQLLPGPALPASEQARAAKSDLRRCRIDPHGNLPQAQKRIAPPGPRSRLLQQTSARKHSHALGLPAHQAWL